ncbi:hypothetical protein EJ419_07370 [Alloscardovia theropitheci]|uniref:Uncharacterized protein n=1 Tax=Alloscardovia theropitheci TaxID=2496842 RepID=A0A4R0QR04_9BIFI|nr:hypothetical protein [Alloscardovia theropitheci]TCD53778.1 hypothetical protein EJ419_07370 [Alloscardovia theropitheci]
MQGEITGQITNILSTRWWSVSNVRVSVIDDMVFAECTLKRLDSSWNGASTDTLFTLPAKYMPKNNRWSMYEPRFGVYVIPRATGNVEFGHWGSTAQMGNGQIIDLNFSWHLPQ